MRESDNLNDLIDAVITIQDDGPTLPFIRVDPRILKIPVPDERRHGSKVSVRDLQIERFLDVLTLLAVSIAAVLSATAILLWLSS